MGHGRRGNHFNKTDTSYQSMRISRTKDGPVQNDSLLTKLVRLLSWKRLTESPHMKQDKKEQTCFDVQDEANSKTPPPNLAWPSTVGIPSHRNVRGSQRFRT